MLNNNCYNNRLFNSGNHLVGFNGPWNETDALSYYFVNMNSDLRLICINQLLFNCTLRNYDRTIHEISQKIHII